MAHQFTHGKDKEIGNNCPRGHAIVSVLSGGPTITTLSLHNQINTPTTTSLQHLKSLLPSKKVIFCSSYQILREVSFTR